MVPIVVWHGMGWMTVSSSRKTMHPQLKRGIAFSFGENTITNSSECKLMEVYYELTLDFSSYFTDKRAGAVAPGSPAFPLKATALSIPTLRGLSLLRNCDL
jgi:hypothetical protein